MKEIQPLFILILTVGCSISPTLPSRQSFTNYHQEIIYPSLKEFERGAILSVEHYPPQNLHGLNLDKSTFKSSPPILSDITYFESSKRTPRGPPLYPLFTPNTIDQRPETVGQIEEYKKALAEEEEEEKKKDNEISSDLSKYLNFDSYDQPSKSFVDVKGDTFNYKYRV